MLFGVQWDDAIAARWSANPLGMPWPGAGERRPSEWQHLEAEAKTVQARWQKAPDVGAAGLVEARQAAISSPVRAQQRQRPDALSIWQMPTRVKEAWSGAFPPTSAGSCDQRAGPARRRSGQRAVSFRNSRRRRAPGPASGWCRAHRARSVRRRPHRARTGVVGGTQRQGAAQSGTRRRFRHSGTQRAEPMADVSSG
jgi:hypothetical protein